MTDSSVKTLFSMLASSYKGPQGNYKQGDRNFDIISFSRELGLLFKAMGGDGDKGEISADLLRKNAAAFGLDLSTIRDLNKYLEDGIFNKNELVEAAAVKNGGMGRSKNLGLWEFEGLFTGDVSQEALAAVRGDTAIGEGSTTADVSSVSSKVKPAPVALPEIKQKPVAMVAYVPELADPDTSSMLAAGEAPQAPAGSSTNTRSFSASALREVAYSTAVVANYGADYKPPPLPPLSPLVINRDAAKNIHVQNFGVVNDQIARGAAPSSSDIAALKKAGVHVIIDFRDYDKNEEKAARANGMEYVNIPLSSTKQPSASDIRVFLATVAAPDLGPFYVHCQGGRHRTGEMMAIYRIVHNGWTADRAFAEMKNDYDWYESRGFSGGHGPTRDAVYAFYDAYKNSGKDLDVALAAYDGAIKIAKK